MKKQHFISTISILLFPLSLILLSGCHKMAQNTSDNSKYILPDSLAKTLAYDTVQKCPVVNTITLSGKVSFNEDNVVKIYPMVSGVIQDIHVMLGDYVYRGEVLGVISSSEMAGYSNDLVNARTNLQVAQKNLDATQDLFKSGLASQKDLVSAQAMRDQAKSELNRVKRVLSINGGNANGNYIVRSPINGFIVDKEATNNMSIRSDNNSELFTISDLKNVWVIANVYESDISKIHLNDNVEISTLAYNDKVFYGKVDKIMNVLDPTNKVMKVRIVLPNPGYLLKPEMFASVTVTNEVNQKAMCVASSAVVFDHSQNFILVYHGNSDIRIIPVQVINTSGNRSFISGDVQPGEKVIASQVIMIYDALNN